MSTSTDVHKSNWGYHPVSHQDFLILKALYKHYWETNKEGYRWMKWDNKLHKIGPEPKVDPLFIKINKPSYFTTTMKDKNTRWHNLSFTRNIQSIVHDFNLARIPAETPEEVGRMKIDMEVYREIHKKIS